MKNFMNAAKGRLNQLKELTFTIQLDGQKLTKLAINNVPPGQSIVLDGVEVSGKTIVISGRALKYKVYQHFSLSVTPNGFNDRELMFTLVNVTPINSKWLNDKVFAKLSPYVLFENNRFTVELDKFAKVQDSPIGKIKKSEIEDDEYVIGFGV